MSQFWPTTPIGGGGISTREVGPIRHGTGEEGTRGVGPIRHGTGEEGRRSGPNQTSAMK